MEGRRKEQAAIKSATVGLDLGCAQCHLLHSLLLPLLVAHGREPRARHREQGHCALGAVPRASDSAERGLTADPRPALPPRVALQLVVGGGAQAKTRAPRGVAAPPTDTFWMTAEEARRRPRAGAPEHAELRVGLRCRALLRPAGLGGRHAADARPASPAAQRQRRLPGATGAATHFLLFGPHFVPPHVGLDESGPSVLAPPGAHQLPHVTRRLPVAFNMTCRLAQTTLIKLLAWHYWLSPCAHPLQQRAWCYLPYPVVAGCKYSCR